MVHFRHNLPYARTPLGHMNTMQAEVNEPTEGDYLSIKQDGEDWPIVICDEEIIQTFFLQSSRPGSARQADGNWGKEFKAGGVSIRDRRFPAIYLGTLKFTWASLKELEPIDIDMGRAIRDSTTNPLLAKAWTEYISQYKGDKIFEWKYLDHWKARLYAQRLDTITSGEFKKQKLPGGKVPEEGRKRKGTPKFRYPPGYSNEELDDEESEDLFLPAANKAGPTIKQEPNNSISSEEIDALYEDPEPPCLTSSRLSKRSRLDFSGRFSMRPSTPIRDGTGRLATPMSSSIRHGTPFPLTNKKVDVNGSNIVIIYVGSPHTKFKVKRSGLYASPLLSSLLTHHPQIGWYIMSPMLSSLDAYDFQPIGEYIERREYYPNLLDDNTSHVRLEGDLTPNMLHDQVVRCGTIYQIAQMLEMPSLQDLAFRKLKGLKSHYQALEILTVIELVFDIGSPELRQYLTQYFAEHFFRLVLAETAKTVEIMAANGDLTKGVFGKWIEQYEKVKRETAEEGKKEEVADEPKGGQESDNPKVEGQVREKPKGEGEETNEVKNDDGKEPGHQINERGKSDEEITKTEEEMVGMALRQSDKEQTEEDWVQLVQKQSDLFEAF